MHNLALKKDPDENLQYLDAPPTNAVVNPAYGAAVKKSSQQRDLKLVKARKVADAREQRQDPAIMSVMRKGEDARKPRFPFKLNNNYLMATGANAVRLQVLHKAWQDKKIVFEEAEYKFIVAKGKIAAASTSEQKKAVSTVFNEANDQLKESTKALKDARKAYYSKLIDAKQFE